MAINPHRISFSTFGDMAAHLDRWAAENLDGREAWGDAVVSSQHWSDYSARNQVLLASYRVDGPVAGAETWRLVPSSTLGRECAVRAGEHGYPVRVPITTGGQEPDPYLGGLRPTRSAVERWEWRPVFSVPQLARRPEPGVLAPSEPPTSFTGDGAEANYLAAVRRVATATVRGRLPASKDPHQVVADAAGRLRRSKDRPELDGVLRDQVAWLVADRVNLARGALLAFDPSALPPRDRWERLQDVLELTRKLTTALGVVCGMDLCASALPRMEVVDDRVVPAGRRHRLPAASFEQLPIGRWVEVGPYTGAEWAARGEDANGRGAFLRLNKSAYLVAVERGTSASWRLEDAASRTGHGALATGDADTLDQACRDAQAAMRSRYPALMTAQTDTRVITTTTESGNWRPMNGEGRSSAELRHLGNDVTVYAIPSPGGRWMPAVNDGRSGEMNRLPLVRTRDEARDAAETVGRRAVRIASIGSPVEVDAMVAELADDPAAYSRRELATVVTGRLLPADLDRVTQAEPAELVQLLGQAGVTPATTVAVLAAERIEASEGRTLATGHGGTDRRRDQDPPPPLGTTPDRGGRGVGRHCARDACCGVHADRDHGQPSPGRAPNPP